MVRLIDKDALVAEIERKRNDYINSFMTEQVHVLNDVLDFLDTLETKQVNLNAELEHYKAEQNIKYEEDINMFEFAKHFFELGMRVNNPITAADRGMVEEIIINLKRVEKDYRINLTREMEWLRNKVK